MAVRPAIPVIATATLIGSASLARRRTVSPCETRLFVALNEAPDRWLPPMWTIMQAGSLGAVPVVSAITGCKRGRRRATIVMATGFGAWLAVKLVKPLVRRKRPAEHLGTAVVRGRRQTGLGYPSGHAAVALALAITTTRRPPTRMIAIAAAGLVGSSRIYVGAHLPLDVVGGWAVGTIAGVAAQSIDGN